MANSDRDSLVALACQWAWRQPDNIDVPLPADMQQKLLNVGVAIKATTADELIDELDPRGTWMQRSISPMGLGPTDYCRQENPSFRK